MVETAFFDGGKLEVQLLDEGGDLFIAEVFENKFVSFEDRQFVVVDIDDFFGVFDDGRGVAGQEMFALSDTDYQRGTLTRGDDGIGVVAVEEDDDVGADHPSKGDTDGFFEAAAVVLLDFFNKVEEDFGVGVALKVIAFLDQFVLELGEVLDDAVVDHGEAAAGGAVGVGVAVVGLPMRRPAGVAHSGVGVEVFADEAVFKFGDLSFLLVYAEVSVEKGDAGAVITAVFEAFEAFQDDWISFSGSDISDDATHRKFNYANERANYRFIFKSWCDP